MPSVLILPSDLLNYTTDILLAFLNSNKIFEYLSTQSLKLQINIYITTQLYSNY